MKETKAQFNRRITKQSKDIQRKEELWDKRLRGTESYKKLWGYVNTLTEDIFFQKKIVNLRRKYSLPLTGIPMSEEDKLFKTYFPKLEKWEKFISEINDFAEKDYGLLSNWSAHTIRTYVLYNELIEPIFGTLSLFKLADLKVMLENRKYTEKEMEESEKMTYEEKIASLTYISEQYPCAILINPYASEREVVDYVKNLWNLGIKPILNKYRNPKVKLGKTRKRSVAKKERNKFIYENRKLGVNKLVSLVAEKFGDILDYTYISRIIKEENEKINVHK